MEDAEGPETERAPLDLDCLDDAEQLDPDDPECPSSGDAERPDSDAEQPDRDDQTDARYHVASTHEVATVWPGTPATFALLTHDDYQFVAFYDAELDDDGTYEHLSGQLTVGQRRVGCGSAWQFVRLDERLAWDAHNDVTMAVDGAGHLHVSGNMHNDPLVYFRTRDPLDVTTLERHREMVGEDESAVTYPEFVRDAQGRLVFGYRSGGSGDGRRIYNVYDADTESWERLLDDPLVDGRGEMNAYPVGPKRGPDGDYHLVWVWRDTPDAATNHDLSYARSPNLVDWERSDGAALDLPITDDEAEIVDPVPAGGGMINGNTKIGFDTQNRVILSYHKFDDEGNTQLYNARREADGWSIYRTSDWDYRWAFGGRGTLEFEIEVTGVRVGDGDLVQSYDHVEYGSGTWVLDEETVTPKEGVDRPPKYPECARTFDAVEDRLRLNWADDLGAAADPDTHYALRWATLPANRDRGHDDVPDPTPLRLYEFQRNDDAT